MLSDFFSNNTVAVVGFAAIALFVYFVTRRRPHLPNIPILGARESDWFPLLQARWRNTKDFNAAMDLAYAQYRHTAVIVPVLDLGTVVMLPPSEIQFAADLPESTLGMNARVKEFYQTDYTFMDPTVPSATLDGSLLRNALTPRLGTLVPSMADEVSWVVEKFWGNDTTEWKEVCVFDTMRQIASGVANRAFVGLPLCRDATLVNNAMDFARDLPVSGMILNLFWKPLRPLVAPFVTVPNRIHTQRFRKVLMPEVDRRLREYDGRKVGADEKIDRSVANDLLQWSIQQAKSSSDTSLCRSQALADSMLIVNFAAVHTTTFISTCALLDLASSTPEIIDELREEITSVLIANDGKFTTWTLAQLVKLDSALRESARLSTIITMGLGRMVTAEEGMITPSGVHLAKGTQVMVPSSSLMRDETLYSNPCTYMPFRFVKERDHLTPGSTKGSFNALPVTKPEFLFFGHGKHACPGRFFAAAELKLMFAHILLHYDFEFLPLRPVGALLGSTQLPPLKSTVKVKKRGGTTEELIQGALGKFAS